MQGGKEAASQAASQRMCTYPVSVGLGLSISRAILTSALRVISSVMGFAELPFLDADGCELEAGPFKLWTVMQDVILQCPSLFLS